MSDDLRARLLDAEERLAQARACATRDEPLLLQTRKHIAALQAGLTAARVKLPEQGRTSFWEVAGSAFELALFSPILLVGVGVVAVIVGVVGSCLDDDSGPPGQTAEGVVVRSDVPQLPVASECSLVLEAAGAGRCVATIRCSGGSLAAFERNVVCRDTARETVDSEGDTTTYHVSLVEDPSLTFDSETDRAEVRLEGASATLWFHDVEGSLAP